MTIEQKILANRDAATKLAIDIARWQGYGHIIATLKKDWAEMLMAKHGMSAEAALAAANVSAYTLAIQHDRPALGKTSRELVDDLAAVPGISAVRVDINANGGTLCAFVCGGDNKLIADIISRHTPMGVKTAGSVEVEDSNGKRVFFTRGDR